MKNKEGRDKYGSTSEQPELKPISEDEIKSFEGQYEIKDNYRVFHKRCEKCEMDYDLNVPENYFHVTLPPELGNREKILRIIYRKKCKVCQPEEGKEREEKTKNYK